MKLRQNLERLTLGNKILEYIIYALCIYIIILPYLPGISFWAQKHVFGYTAQDPVISEVDRSVDTLIIPTIDVNRAIVERTSMTQVHEDVWRRPNASAPDLGSNTVLVAHRYATIGGNRASTFYNLPNLNIGDTIYVVWEGKVYVYTIFSTDTVEPTAIEIEAPTAEPTLTLYTCTPLWTASHRFVVRAHLDKVL